MNHLLKEEPLYPAKQDFQMSFPAQLSTFSSETDYKSSLQENDSEVVKSQNTLEPSINLLLNYGTLNA